jgi:hypothetical protein
VATALAIGAAFLLGLRVGIAFGHRAERERARKRDVLSYRP